MSEEKRKNPMDWMEDFLLTASYKSAFSLLNKIDEVVRICSGQAENWDTLIANQEKFSKAITKCILKAVYVNLDADTVTDGSEWKSMAGGFPKWKGNPGFSHLMWGLKKLEQEIEEFKDSRDSELH